MSKQQTAVEWLEDNIDSGMPYREILILIEQAKQMEKEQIKDAYKFGISDEYVIGADRYYNQTFKK